MLFLHGRLLWNRDHGKEALTYFEEAQILYAKQKDLSSMARMCYYRAGIYKALADYPEAQKRIDEALALSDKIGTSLRPFSNRAGRRVSKRLPGRFRESALVLPARSTVRAIRNMFTLPGLYQRLQKFVAIKREFSQSIAIPPI